jgi:hypothetical protein
MATSCSGMPASSGWRASPPSAGIGRIGRGAPVSALGRETMIAEVDQYFGKDQLDRYRDIGNGKIQFVFHVAGKEATLDFARYPDGVHLLKIGPLGPPK